MTPDSFIDYFRARHGWKCRSGSAVFKDLTSFVAEQASAGYEIEDLYVLFCVSHGLQPKDKTEESTE